VLAPVGCRDIYGRMLARKLGVGKASALLSDRGRPRRLAAALLAPPSTYRDTKAMARPPQEAAPERRCSGAGYPRAPLGDPIPLRPPGFIALTSSCRGL
jgi:hypothetical protein